VVAGPAGARVRTRLRLSQRDAEVLAAVGGYLGSLAGADLAQRCAQGRLDVQRLTQLKHDLAAVVSVEALFSLTDLCRLAPDDAIASLVRTATTVTEAAATRPQPARRSPPPRSSRSAELVTVRKRDRRQGKRPGSFSGRQC
jgi:hypothetical protein